MKILDRHLARSFLWPFLFTIIIFSVLFIVIDGFNNLDEFLKHGVTPRIVLSYYLYTFPSVLVQIVPISVLVAILYALGQLNRHHEITAMKAGGVSAFLILSPYFFMGLVLSFVILLVNESVVPQSSITSTAIMDGLIKKGKKNFEERAVKNVTLYGAGGRMIFAREYEVESQTLHDIVILDERPGKNQKTKLTAKKASYRDSRWVFEDVMKYRFNRAGNLIGQPSFSKELSLELEEKPDDFIHEASQVDFMNARELKTYIENLKGSSRKLLRRLWVDYHNKIAFPFISFIVMVIGAPLAMRGERGSAMVGIGTSFIVVLSYYAVDSICLALGKGGLLTPMAAAWLSNILFAGVGIYLIKKTA